MDFHLTRVNTGSSVWDAFVPTIGEFLSHDKSYFDVDGRRVSGYRSPDTRPVWLRDHTHQMKGFKYFETDMTSALDVFRRYQHDDGAFFDFFFSAESEYKPGAELPKLRDRFLFDAANKIQFARCGVEADVEYLAVEAVYQAWQTTGDDDWMADTLDSLERGLSYSLSSSERWSHDLGLVKRPFTIDTWDFEFGEFHDIDGKKVHASNLRGDHNWCIMHGDNTGVANSCRLLARLFDWVGNNERAQQWRERGSRIASRTNEVCWNGSFYTHQVHITPVETPVDESVQLSLSNAYSLNRRVPDHAQCASIIREYIRRRKKNQHSFAEWYSIDPPFPNFAFGLNYPPGHYVNGGIMPLVGGELARAAFEHGFEDYAVDILRRYYDLAIVPRETYLWYLPDGSHFSGGSFLATDGWGSAAMLYAFAEGLVGIRDTSKLFESVCVSPRWPAAGIREADVDLAYPASGARFGYEYELDSSRLTLATRGTGKSCSVHAMVPRGCGVLSVSIDGRTADYTISRVEQTPYVDVDAGVGATVEIVLTGE